MNRFLFLENELKTFKDNPNKLAKSKSTEYSTQKNPAAVAGAVIAGAGLTWKIFEWIAGQTEGDITVKLARLEGAKYPSDDEQTYKNKGVWNTKTVRVKQKVTNHIGDEISATVDLRFKHNGYAVADIDMDLSDSNDAVGWGLSVEAKMMPDRNNYTSNNGGQTMSMIEVTFNYRFTRSIGSDIIKIKRYKLYGDGTVIER